jgi:hypothetical protein
MMLTHGDTTVVLRERMRGHFMIAIRRSWSLVLAHDLVRKVVQLFGIMR